MRTITIRIDEGVAEQLKAEANGVGISRSAYLRQIIDNRNESEHEQYQTEKDGDHVTCDKCGYDWVYGGDMMHPTCPSCASKVWKGVE